MEACDRDRELKLVTTGKRKKGKGKRCKDIVVHTPSGLDRDRKRLKLLTTEDCNQEDETHYYVICLSTSRTRGSKRITQ